MKSIVLKDVSHRYGSEKVLNSVSFEIEKGEFFTLLGPSGCGKTTILRILAGFVRPYEGRVFLNGADITDWEPERRNMGIVFQNYALFPNMTVEENIAYGLKIRKQAKKIISEKCSYYMELAGLKEYRGKKIDQLSGGQQQRVAIARAMVIEPGLLLLDEPMSNLDVSLRIKMREEIRAIQKKVGITTLFITHDQQEALAISDRIAVMEKGRIHCVGTPKEIYNNPSGDFAANFIGVSNRLEREEYEKFGIGNGKSRASHIYVRPEQFAITREKGRGVAVRIEDIKFAGMYFEYKVTEKGRTYTVTALNTGASGDEWKIGDEGYLSIIDTGMFL